MLHLPSFKKLLKEPGVYKAVRCVCKDGAPWKKPTAIIANSVHILALDAVCPGCPSHITLQGKAPGGESWTSIASPYWPMFAKKMAQTWAWAKNLERSHEGSHIAGWNPADAGGISQALSSADFTPSGKRSRDVIATRVAAGLQPIRRALPQLVPDGLSPDLHLQIAHSVAHPYTARPSPTAPIQYAIEHSIADDMAASEQREQMLSVLERMAAAVEHEDKHMLSMVNSFIRPIVAKRSMAFIREVSFAAVA